MEVRTALRPLAAGKRATGFPSAALRAGRMTSSRARALQGPWRRKVAATKEGHDGRPARRLVSLRPTPRRGGTEKHRWVHFSAPIRARFLPFFVLMTWHHMTTMVVLAEPPLLLVAVTT
jgi:hypothetical protein